MSLLCTGDNSSEDCDDENEVLQRPAKTPRKSMVTLSKILGNQPSSSSKLSLAEKIEKDLDYYKHSPNMDTDSCPLSWWRDKQGRLSLLSKVARKYLCICATSIS